jgi:hypothetical protein
MVILPTGRVVPDEGMNVVQSSFISRRLACGDLVLVTADVPAELDAADETQGALPAPAADTAPLAQAQTETGKKKG